MLNSSKGPAVRALRAQTDKREYAIEMKKVVDRLVYTNLFHHNLDTSVKFVCLVDNSKSIFNVNSELASCW